MKPELLAPAGSYEGFTAALNAGADAVYLGGNMFGARAYAANLGEEELLRAIGTARILEKKLYLTVNTLVKDHEFEALYDFLLPLYERGLDAVIVQDTGVLAFIRKHFPGLDIHASTQMAVTGPSGAALLEKAGVKRVIPARELSLPEIRAIHENTDLEIECFVHGALCYCYSGQCLMSSIFGGRSGNRGRCAGVCRLPWDVAAGENAGGRSQGDRYLLNTKDICAAPYITDMAEAGVTSFKIEGRMKSPEYTAGVVGIYRKYMDLWEAGVLHAPLTEEDRDMLEGLFNREGFGKSYLFSHNGPGMIAVHGGTEGDKSKRSKEVYARVRREMKDARAARAVDLVFSAEEGRMVLEAFSGDLIARAESAACEKAGGAPTGKETVEKQLKKTGGTLFEVRNFAAELKGELFIPVKELNALRRTVLEELSDAASPKRKEKAWPYAGSITETPGGVSGMPETVSVSALGESIGQIRELTSSGIADKVYVPYGLLKKQGAEKLRKLFENGRTVPAVALPRMRGTAADPEAMGVLKDAVSSGWEILVRNMEDAALLAGRKGAVIRLDQSVYTMNARAREFWREQGIVRDTVPYELNEKEIASRDNTDSELIVYGRIPLMISAQCLLKTEGKCRKTRGAKAKTGPVFLRDRKGVRFPVLLDCDFCYNVIYNSVPLSLLSLAERVKNTGAGGFRLEFTDESPEEVSRVMKAFEKGLRGGSGKEWFDFTRGHFTRGVL